MSSTIAEGRVLAKMDEFGLIRLLNAGRQSPEWQRARGVAVGIGDDAAVVTPGGSMQLVLSCDTMVQDIHFKAETMADYDIGFKAMASSVSDLAAMGAIPRHALVSLVRPPGYAEARLRELYDGLYACADRCGVAVVGGDTTSTNGGLVVSVTAVGEVERDRAMLRSAACEGDAVFVTGALGLSAAGLHALLAGRAADAHASLIEAHQRPLPQIAAGRLLLRSGLCRALNDISDGLASEAREIAEASGCGIVLREAALPLTEPLLRYAAASGTNALEWALYGGEDYQLVGTLPERDAARVGVLFREAALPFHIIGEATGEAGTVRLQRADGSVETVTRGGYNHFPPRERGRK